jgi:hypothetical protein
MFTQLMKWVRGQPSDIEVMQNTVAALQEQLTVLQQANTAAAKLIETQRLESQRLREAQKAAEEEIEAKRNGIEPWVEIKSADFDAVRGFKIELDWNEAFIQHLKESGVKGKTEEEVVQRWLGFLYGDLVDKLERSVIDNSDKPTTNDFL